MMIIFEELEDILIMSDIGVNTVVKFVDKLKKRVKEESIKDTDTLKEIIIDELLIMYVDNGVLKSKINYSDEGPTVILFIGVNGVGKTTSIGKIANKLKKEGKKVLLVTADTFRAGAIEQLKEWGQRLDIEVVSTTSKDPSAAVYDGLDRGIKGEYDVILIDTAGRLQNKVNLMNELEKMNNVIKKVIPSAPSETLLVIDASSGQNGIMQAKAFSEVTDITGIVLTKLDGTAKGGIILAIKEETNIPVKFVGLGEGEDDLQTFDIEKNIFMVYLKIYKRGKGNL
ncbi:MAG: signal recognition particle-docking protein FtsY [Bacilli bacterium]|nr:MAG: signal recognition particle-docking protein FtsY [Bacilli bacterium]